MRRSKLGKGLENLIESVAVQPANQVQEIQLSQIQANPYQPRKHFSNDEIEGLADSIRRHGLLQPIVVKVDTFGSYLLIAGERRLRAFRFLGRTQIPAVIKAEVENEHLLQLALIENIQREDLNPIEKARAYQDMIQQLGLTQEAVATQLGKSRTAIANSVRLLKLPEEVQGWVSTGRLSEGHAKVLLQVVDTKVLMSICQQALAEDWSVRRLEKELGERDSKGSRSLSAGNGKSSFSEPSAHVLELQDRLCAVLGTRVRIAVSKKNQYKGKIIIEFHHNDDFENVIQHILRD